MLPCLPSSHLLKFQENRALGFLVHDRTWTPRKCLARSGDFINEWINEWRGECYLSVVMLGDVLLLSVFDFFLTQSPLEGPHAAICIYFPVFDHDLSFLIRTDFSCSVGIFVLRYHLSFPIPPEILPSWSLFIIWHSLVLSSLKSVQVSSLLLWTQIFFWHLLGTTVGEISWILSSLLLRKSCV